jgi:hypothetical protein
MRLVAFTATLPTGRGGGDRLMGEWAAAQRQQKHDLRLA